MVDIKKAMIRARNKADGEKDSPEMDMPENNEIHEYKREQSKPIEIDDLLEHEINAVELYWQYLQGNLSKKEKEIFEEILRDEEDHLDKIKSLMGLKGKELVMEHMGEGKDDNGDEDKE